jgi:protein required for attachment to host cells
MNTVVVVANSTRARFFTLQQAESPTFESGPRLVECRCLANPEQEASDRELWSDSKSGRNRSSGGGGAHGYDDHREQHRAEYDRRFMQSVAVEAERLARSEHAMRVVVTADNRTLGLLRGELHRSNGFDLREVGKDYSKLSATALHEHLAALKLVPARRRPSIH